MTEPIFVPTAYDPDAPPLIDPSDPNYTMVNFVYVCTSCQTAFVKGTYPRDIGYSYFARLVRGERFIELPGGEGVAQQEPHACPDQIGHKGPDLLGIAVLAQLKYADQPLVIRKAPNGNT